MEDAKRDIGDTTRLDVEDSDSKQRAKEGVCEATERRTSESRFDGRVEDCASSLKRCFSLDQTASVYAIPAGSNPERGDMSEAVARQSKQTAEH